MFTRASDPNGRKPKPKQRGAEKGAKTKGAGLHIVKHHARRLTAPKAQKARRKVARKGGWKTTRYLDHGQFKQGYSDALSLCRAGYSFNVFASLMPPDHIQPDAARIRWIDTKLARIGQALKRRKQPDIRFRTLEKKIGGKLHGHAPVYVAPDNLDVIERMFDVFDKSRVIAFDPDASDALSVPLHASLIGETEDDLQNAILYTLKQHRWAGPGRDGAGSKRRFWIEAGDPIKGQRLSLSKGARSILQTAAAKHTPAPAVDAPVAIPEPVVKTPSPPVQLVLIETPQIDIRSQIETTRLARGLSQRQVAAVLGMKQPHYSNAVVRRHDPLGPYARTRALEWLKAA